MERKREMRIIEPQHLETNLEETKTIFQEAFLQDDNGKCFSMKFENYIVAGLTPDDEIEPSTMKSFSTLFDAKLELYK